MDGLRDALRITPRVALRTVLKLLKEKYLEKQEGQCMDAGIGSKSFLEQ